LFLILLVPDGAEDDFTFNGNTGVINAADFQFVPGTNNEWRFAKLTIPIGNVPAGGTGVVVNSSEFFHLGIIHGSAGGGCRYGYFSDFSAFGYEISASEASLCEGNTLELSTNLIDGATYNWTGPNGFSSQGQTITLENASVPQTGYYFVSGNLPDACQLLEDSVFIEIHPSPSPMGFTFQDLCDGQSLSFSFSTIWHGVEGGTTAIDFGDGQNNPNAESPLTHTYSSFGSYVVTMTSTTPAGCSNTAKITAQVNETPTVQTSSFSYCSNSVSFESQINMGQTLAEIENFYWFIDGDSIPNVANPTVSVQLEPGIHPGSFGLTNSDGCHYTFSFDFFVDNALELDNFDLPNVITPNNDQINDFFLVDDIFNDCVPYTIEFLNRWGQVVYTMTSNDNAFGGVDDTGYALADGVYFYVFKSEWTNTHGFLHIIRD
jgi:gliding motility-associated-like protein